MKFAAWVVGCIFGVSLVLPTMAQQSGPPQQRQLSSPWWVTGELGAGQIKLRSDQQPGDRLTTFALGFSGGYQPKDWVRVGLHVNGWLLQAFSLNDPTVGESVSNVGGVVVIFPSRKSGMFARGGFGMSAYTNNRPTGANGNGPDWEVGGGYEIPVHGRIRLAPMVEYSAGGLGNGAITLPVQSGFRYSVVEFKLAMIGGFGHRR
jgi:hypothetical protein